MHGVHGNVDDEALRRMLPAARGVELGGVRIGMIHDAGPAAGRLARMRLRFPDADAVSSATRTSRCTSADARRLPDLQPRLSHRAPPAPTHTMGIATVEDGRVHFELIAL